MTLKNFKSLLEGPPDFYWTELLFLPKTGNMPQKALGYAEALVHLHIGQSYSEHQVRHYDPR